MTCQIRNAFINEAENSFKIKVLAAPCLNLRSFGIKCTVLKKVLVNLMGLFGALAVIRRFRQWFRGPIAIRPPGNCALLAPRRYVPACKFDGKCKFALVNKRSAVPPLARGPIWRNRSNRFKTGPACRDELAVHSSPLLCLHLYVAKVASGLFFCWSALRNTIMTTSLQTLLSCFSWSCLTVCDCWMRTS